MAVDFEDMTLRQMQAEWLEDYEREYGYKPSKNALRIIQRIGDIGDALRKRGALDAKRGCPPCVEDIFLKMAGECSIACGLDNEFAQDISELWKSEYMDGFQACQSWVKPIKNGGNNNE